MKKAILNMADTGATESTAYMLRCAGYECSLPDDELLEEIRWQAKCQGAYSVGELVRQWGYAPPEVPCTASLRDILDCDLFVDVKAHINHPGIINHWPHLKGKVLWCCLNGGDPTKRVEPELWVNPPCPVLTNNQWYQDRPDAYACYPPYVRLGERQRRTSTGAPLCLCHNVAGWGYGHLVDALREQVGIRFLGGGVGTDQLLPHRQAMEQLEGAVALVHVKLGDTVGYAVVEAMAAAVPVLVTQEYIDQTRLHDLLEPGVTCLTFDPSCQRSAVDSVRSHLDHLSDPRRNQTLGQNGRRRLEEVMWSVERDGDSFRSFLERNFR